LPKGRGLKERIWQLVWQKFLEKRATSTGERRRKGPEGGGKTQGVRQRGTFGPGKEGSVRRGYRGRTLREEGNIERANENSMK